MNNIENRLLGRLEEFKDWATNEFNHIHSDHKLIQIKLDQINQDRWVLYGKIAVINGLLMAIFQLVVKKVIPL